MAGERLLAVKQRKSSIRHVVKDLDGSGAGGSVLRFRHGERFPDDWRRQEVEGGGGRRRVARSSVEQESGHGNLMEFDMWDPNYT
jgi:hypothetical protein